jgi:hypothetical protein
VSEAAATGPTGPTGETGPTGAEATPAVPPRTPVPPTGHSTGHSSGQPTGHPTCHPTEHPVVDEVLASLDGLDTRPTGEHVAVFESAHDRLRSALADVGDAPASDRVGG